MELLIQNATIVDGTGREAYIGDVAVDEGKIRINPQDVRNALRVIDGTGKVVCPGFIDAHSHGDLVCGRDFQNLSKTSQGVTTEIAGNCGITLAPISRERMDLVLHSGEYGEQPEMVNWTSFANYMEYLDKRPKTLNTALFVGHSTIRTAVMGVCERPATAEELKQMKEYLEEALLAGAMGLSTGLVYIPGTYADTEELIELAKILKPWEAAFASHMRNESYDVVKSVEEIIKIGREAGIHVFISHHKVLGRSNWGLQKETLSRIKGAIEEGVKITCDQYPYTRNMTGVRVCIPPDYLADGMEKMAEYLKDRSIRREIRRQMEDKNSCFDNYYLNAGGWGGITICTSPGVLQAVGKTVEEYAKEIGKDPFDAYFDLMIENKGLGYAVFDCMCEADLLEIAAFEHTIIGSDGDIYSAEGITHPRVFGTFPRAICYYSKDKKILTLEQVINKMTYKTAVEHKLKNKGAILEGYDGDLVIFDYDKLQDKAAYTNSNQVAEGIEQVVVDGVIVYEDKQLTGKYPGKIIRRTTANERGQHEYTYEYTK